MTAVLALALLAATASPAPAEHALLRSERTAVIEMRTAALIMSGRQGGALPIAVAAVPDGRACGDGARDCLFTALVEIDGATLLEGMSATPGSAASAPNPGDGPLTVEIFAYVLGVELDVIEQRSLSLDIDLRRHRELLANTGLKAFLPLEITPGNHLLRVLVHAGEAFGLRGLELPAGVAREGAAGVRSLTPVFIEPAQPWLLAAPAGVEIPLPPPFGLEATSPLPAARPLMPAGGTISGQVFIAGAAAHDLVAHDLVAHDLVAHDLVAWVRRAGGETVEVPLTIHDRTAASGLESVAISFSTPGFEPGLYEIAVAETPSEGAQADKALARSDFVPIFIESGLSAAASGEFDDVAPTTLRADVAAAADPSRPPLAGSQRRLMRVAGDEYAQALSRLAAGEHRAALETLMASEQRVVEAFDADAVDILLQGQSRVLARLPDADWGCVLPVVLMHLDLSRAYRRSGRRILAHHATRMTIDLADAYAHKLATPQARAEAARALSSLGGYSQHGGARSQAERLYTRALDLAGDDAPALLGLATSYEKRGLFDQAVPVFESLVADRPEHAEGALRLAVNRARTGQVESAREALGELTARRDSDWIALLAHQELARLLIDEGHLSRAEGVLRQGRERWPDHPTLQLQLAWVLDAQGEFDGSRELLENFSFASRRGNHDSGAAQPAGERSRYNRWSGELLAASRRALAETARRRLPDLGRWLADVAADGG